MDTRLERRATHLIRTRRLFLVFLAVFALFVFRLWKLQIVEGETYRRLADNNRIRVEKIVAPRGIIYDRNGVPLVKNVPAFDISVVPEEFSLENLPLLARLIGRPDDEVEKKILAPRRFPKEPVKVRINATMEEVARVEARRLELPGVSVDLEISRSYLYGSVASHVLGYLGRLRPDQKQKPEYRYIPMDAFVGQWGLEARFDEVLRGEPGDRIFEVDALGQRIRQVGVHPPQKGEDLHLTLDLEVQQAAEEALADQVGAAVALDPLTGDIFALVSRPSFDPNLFATGISTDAWNALLLDPKKPLFNRALQSQFPPGSTFKIAVALAALEEHAIDPEEEVVCTGKIRFGDREFRCWKKGGHGKMNLHRALVQSCDVYFYDLSLRLGIDTIARYARLLGLGRRPGVGLVSEATGLVPTRAWKKKRFGIPWYRGETLNASIGQGYVLTSPFQMAWMTATVANEGTLFEPRLVQGAPVRVVQKTSFQAETIKRLDRALQGVVEDPHGTARRVRTDRTTVAGKTGTAQVTSLDDWKALDEEDRGTLEDHGWFVAFAPADDPQIALAVIVEHGGHGGSVAGPIARKMIEAFDPTRRKIEQCGAGGSL